MADKRKLQGEIDRCLKRVAEGVEQFEDIWQKVHSASNANQKEKYEADLKKEIKKLQRLRDQIKTWLTSNDIKDKRPLMENRRLIETQMERFKVVERETKTKAYSKEGLVQTAKVDPAQREKEEARHWLTDCIDKLNIQIDQFESEVESLYIGTRKKKLDRDKQDRVDELQGWVERHKYHIQRLETIMRMMDNCSLETSKVKALQEDFNYYLESNQEPDFAEDELMYDDMDLDEASSGMYSSSTAVATGSAPHQIVNDEELNSVSSSPTLNQAGPLSPKTPTAIKSTSQELFEERRRGKTSVSSSSDYCSEPVPPSPKKPVNKSFLQNSTVPAKAASSNKVTTPPTPTVNKTNALPSTKPSVPPTTSSSTTSSTVSSGSSTNGESSPRGTGTKLAQPPSGSAYAIAAGGHQQNSVPSSATHSSGSSNSPTIPMSNTTEQGQSSVVPSGSTTSTTGTSELPSPTQSNPSSGNSNSSSSSNSSTSSNDNTVNSSDSTTPSAQQHGTSQPRPLGTSVQPLSRSEQHSRSSSSSSLSPSTLSQESQPNLSQPSTGGGSVGAVAEFQGATPVSSGGSADAQQTSAPISESGPLTVETSQPSPSSSSQTSALSPAGVVAASTNSTPLSQPSVSTPPPTMAPTAPTLPQVMPTPTWSMANPDGFVSGGLTGTTGLGLGLGIVQTPSSTESNLLPMWMSATTSSSGSIATSSSNSAASSEASTGLSSSLSTGSPPLQTSTTSPLLMAVSQQQHSLSFSFSTSASSLSANVTATAPETSTSLSMFGAPDSSILASEGNFQSSLSSLKAMAAQVVASSNTSGAFSKPESMEPMIRPILDPAVAAPGSRLLGESIQPVRTDTQLQPLLGVTPLGPVQLTQDKVYQLKMLESACKHLPQPSDSERVRPYLQRTPYPTAFYHHQHPPPHFDSFEFFQRLTIETLFFIFYYMEGTKAQYMAAKALKKLSWRFHTKYMMWFQRLEEPKAITDEYEMGTYIYFDFEKWSQRKKEGFTFEYRYLEDKDLP